MAILFGVGQGIIMTGKGFFVGNKVGIGGAFDWATKNSGDFISDYIEIKETLKNLTENNSRVVLHRLQRKGLIEKKNNECKLTLLGLRYFKKIKQNNIEKKKEWDGKWRIVMFDVPEKYRKERNWLRFQLFGFEYQQLQKSVFLGKWPLTEDFFSEIVKRKLNNFIRLITIGEIDDEKILKSFI